MKVDKKVELSSIKVQDVGNTCIMLVSKFSRAIHQKRGVVIQLHKPHVLNTVAALAALADDPKMNAIYQQIDHEIRQYLKVEHPHSYDTLTLNVSKNAALQNQISP